GQAHRRQRQDHLHREQGVRVSRSELCAVAAEGQSREPDQAGATNHPLLMARFILMERAPRGGPTEERQVRSRGRARYAVLGLASESCARHVRALDLVAGIAAKAASAPPRRAIRPIAPPPGRSCSIRVKLAIRLKRFKSPIQALLRKASYPE